MLTSRARSLVSSLAFLVLVGGCSRADERVWPSRNYSGVYTVSARASANTCPAPLFTPRDTLVFTLLQSEQNQGRVDIAPVASVVGDFRGDRLEAYAAVSVKPTGEAGASAPADSVLEPGPADSIRYRLTLDFEGNAFKGSYRVEQPALAAGVKACEQVFEVKGTEEPPGSLPAASR
jgi:hypothetical protein